MWLNGMMNPSNPLSVGEVDDAPEDLLIYDDDPQGPSPFEDSENNFVMEPVDIENAELITSLVLQVVNLFDHSINGNRHLYQGTSVC